MKSPVHGRNRFGFHPSNSPSPIQSPVVGKIPPRFTPSPTKLESPRSLLNNNHADNGNVLLAKNNANVLEKKVHNPVLLANAKAAYICVKSDYVEELSSKAELKQLLQISGEKEL